MRRSLIISGIAHAVVLGWGLVAFAARPNDAPPTEPLPVEFVSSTDFTQLTTGVKNAPKPVRRCKAAGRQGRRAEAGQRACAQSRRQARGQDRRCAAAQAGSENRDRKPPRRSRSQSPKPKDETKPKTDQIADALKKEEVKKPPKKPPEFKPDQIAEELKKDEAKKTRPAPKFDADQVAALLDKRDPQRQLASAETLTAQLRSGRRPATPRNCRCRSWTRCGSG